MKIGFFNNQIDERATWQTYLYAKYARKFLGHETAIYYPATPYHETLHPKKRGWLRKWLRPAGGPLQKTPCHQKMADRMMRDGIPVVATRLDADFGGLDALHHVKSGEQDGFIPRGTKYWVHAVFHATQPHGNRYLAVSRWLGRRDGTAFVPHIVEVADDPNDLRQELGIPADAFVFGRFGGYETFDIPWVWAAIKEVLGRCPKAWFLFANTEIKLRHERVIGLPTIYDNQVSLEVQKRRFINTSNAMLHARTRGETFGIAIGEFAICDKPVLTHAQSPELAQLDMLSQPLAYQDQADLVRWLEKGVAGEFPAEDGGYYKNCTPEKVMAIFDQGFIR
jgi:hypothetical protein